MQMLPARWHRHRFGRTGGSLRDRGPGFYIAFEQLVHQGDNLGYFRVAELARKQAAHVFDHQSALRLENSVLRRADEHQAELVLAVFQVITHFEGGRFFGKRIECGERACNGLMETATDVAGPAYFEDTAAAIEHQARV